MEDLITSDLILTWLKTQVEIKNPISPHVWADSAQKLNILVADDFEKLYQLEEQLSHFKMECLSSEQKRSVAHVKLMAEANPLNREINVLRSKIKRIEEAIRIAKLQSRLNSENIRGYY